MPVGEVLIECRALGAGVTLERIAREVLTEVLNEIASAPDVPEFEGALKHGWSIVASGGGANEGWAVAENPSTVLPPRESQTGPAPYDYARGIEEGHRGHWVDLRPRRARRRHRQKLIRWIQTKGPEWMREQLADRKFVWIPRYPPHPFAQPILERCVNNPRLIRAVLRRLG